MSVLRRRGFSAKICDLLFERFIRINFDEDMLIFSRLSTTNGGLGLGLFTDGSILTSGNDVI